MRDPLRDRSAVVGVSFGGYVAIELGLTHPEQVDKLVLVDAAGLAPTAEETQQVAANFGGKQHIADLLIPKDPDELGRLIKTLFYKPRCIPKCVLREILQKEFWQNKEAKRQICERMDAEGGFLAPAALRGISAPTLLIWGRYDPLILPSIGIISILTFIGNFNAFDLIYSTQGALAGPNYATDILGTFLYRVFFGFQLQVGDPHMGATIAAVMFLIILTGVMIYLLGVQRRMSRYQF